MIEKQAHLGFDGTKIFQDSMLDFFGVLAQTSIL